jgi:hypothetical protein
VGAVARVHLRFIFRRYRANEERRMQRAVHVVSISLISLVALGFSGLSIEGSQRPSSAFCTTAASPVTLAALPEASGMAAGRSMLWLHNDSGEPALIAVNQSGQQVGRVTVTGARVDDWEALATGPCGKERCLFVGDIGDNNASRKHITIYRVAEPSKAGGSATAEAFHATYPDGAQDAETLLAAPDGGLFIVTKGETSPVRVYKFPRDVRAGITVRLERMGQLKPVQEQTDRVTDGAFSPDGRWVVLRTRRSLTFYRADEFVLGHFREVQRVDLSSLKEPQGEAVTFGSGNTVYVASEGGGKKQAGTLASLSCAL